MKQLTADHKHRILMEYAPYSHTNSFEALAVRTGGGVTKQLIQQWYRRWDGTSASLQHKAGAGRPRVLSRAQVARHIQPRIRSANRKHQAIHYPDILPAVRAATHSSVSLRSIRRYGKEQLGAKKKRTKKRTTRECKSMQGRKGGEHMHLSVQNTD